jgi:hypothetical protein
MVQAPLLLICTNLPQNYRSIYVFPILLAFSFFFLRQSDSLFDLIVNNSKKIRKLLSGKENIEDFWIDVLTTESGQVKEFGLIQISWRNRQHKIHGDLYSADCIRLGEFRSTLSKFDGECLEFMYRREVHEQREIIQAKGLASYNFRDAGDSEFPYTFNGEFFDDRMSERVHIKGYRVTDSKDRTILAKIDDINNRGEIVALVRRYAKAVQSDTRQAA